MAERHGPTLCWALLLLMQLLLMSGWLLSPFPLHILLSQMVFKNPSAAEGPKQELSPMVTRHLSVIGLLGPFRIHWAGLFHLEIWTSQVQERPDASWPWWPQERSCEG